MLDWILYKWFSFTISKSKIDADYFTSKMFAFVNSRGRWKRKYSYVKFVYCSDKYLEIYGLNKYSDLADRLFKVIDSEEVNSRKRISEQIKIFLNKT